ncbi:MAG: hypothetical protein LBP57_03855 [Endomicrobium sp.]|nr:hypothetical protein [Endomicrobium sp.]
MDRVVEQKKSTNLVNTTADLNSLSHSNIPDTTFATILYENLYKDFKDRGLSDVQSRARAKIGIEVYQGEPGHIVFNGSHFYYVDGTDKRYEGQTYANCSIYALIRLLKHLGQCGYIDTDFWKQYSDEELRIMIDNMGARGKGYYISQGVTVVPLTLHTLMQTLIPEVPDQYRQIYKPNGIMLTRDDL